MIAASVSKILLQATKVIAMLVLLAQAINAIAAVDDKDARYIKQNFQSCSIIAAELFTALQLLESGVPSSSLSASLPNLSDGARQRIIHLEKTWQREGSTTVYSSINARYAKCSKAVYQRQGKPGKSDPEYLFYFCSGENKLRYQIILAMFQGVSAGSIIKAVPKQRAQLALYMYDLFLKSKQINTLFDFSATELKRCLNQ